MTGMSGSEAEPARPADSVIGPRAAPGPVSLNHNNQQGDSALEAWAVAAEARQMELTLFDQDRPTDSRSRSYRILPGRIPIALSAPHAVRQRRVCSGGDLDLHRSEPYTGPLAIQLHRATGAWAIYATRTARRDPNHAPDAPYKRAGLVALARRAAPRLILDLHGAHRERDFAVAIGTSPQLRAGRAQAAIDLLAARLAVALDSAVMVDPPEFRADGAGTIAAYCWSALGIPAVQLEISRAYRSALQNPLAYAALCAALRDVIVELASLSP